MSVSVGACFYRWALAKTKVAAVAVSLETLIFLVDSISCHLVESTKFCHMDFCTVRRLTVAAHERCILFHRVLACYSLIKNVLDTAYRFFIVTCACYFGESCWRLTFCTASQRLTSVFSTLLPRFSSLSRLYQHPK